MNAEERMSFREWTEHYEKEQENQRAQISDLMTAVSSLSADVKTLTESHRGILSRLNRPQPVAAYVSALLASMAVMISFSTLLVQPIKDNVQEIRTSAALEEANNLQLHIMLKEDIERNTAGLARETEAQRWLEKLEERYNARIHGDLQ
jgi:hypothetical protein